VDRAGDWNGPDFRATGDYLRKSGMGQLIYAFLYTIDPESDVARKHPDWVLGGNTLTCPAPRWSPPAPPARYLRRPLGRLRVAQ